MNFTLLYRSKLVNNIKELPFINLNFFAADSVQFRDSNPIIRLSKIAGSLSILLKWRISESNR